MMRQYYGARISLAEMEKPIAFVSSNISYKVKENDHIPGVVTEVKSCELLLKFEELKNQPQTYWFYNLELITMKSQVKC